MSKKEKKVEATEKRPRLRVIAIPIKDGMGWLRLETRKRWLLVRYQYEGKDVNCPWRVEIIAESDKEYKALKKLDFRSQVAKLLECSLRDAGKLLKLIEVELNKLEAEAAKTCGANPGEDKSESAKNRHARKGKTSKSKGEK